MIFQAARLLKAGFIFTREGVLSLIDTSPMPKPARMAVKFLRVFEKSITAENKLGAALTKLGPSYVKLGQFLATRPDIIGAKMALNLTALQDKVPPFSMQEARAIIEETFDKPLEQVFDTFSEPVAAASVAQVHKATVNGKTVAVKLLRPNVHDRFRKDLKDFTFAAKIFNLHPKIKRLRPMDVVNTLERSVALEMDLRLEAAALSEMKASNENEKDFYIPQVDWVLTGRQVLTLEWIDGIKLNELEKLKSSGFDLKQVAETLMQSFLKNALNHGFFHADMHQGNLFLDKQGKVVAIDFGIMGRLGHKERLFLAEILYGFVIKDYRRVAEVHFEAGYVPKHHSVDEFAQSLRAIGEPIHSQPASEISIAKLLGLLFDITSIFDMETRKELILLQKTMVVVEGVARSLDPDFNMWVVSKPVIEVWLKERLGVKGKLEETGRALETTINLLKETPDLIEKLRKKLDEPPVKPNSQNYLYISIFVLGVLLLLNLMK